MFPPSEGGVEDHKGDLLDADTLGVLWPTLAGAGEVVGVVLIPTSERSFSCFLSALNDLALVVGAGETVGDLLVLVLLIAVFATTLLPFAFRAVDSACTL